MATQQVWKVCGLHGGVLLTIGAPTASPGALTPKAAAGMVGEWFPQGHSAAIARGQLVAIATGLKAKVPVVHGAANDPAVFIQLCAVVRDALLRGRMSAQRVMGPSPVAAPVQAAGAPPTVGPEPPRRLIGPELMTPTVFKAYAATLCDQVSLDVVAHTSTKDRHPGTAHLLQVVATPGAKTTTDCTSKDFQTDAEAALALLPAILSDALRPAITGLAALAGATSGSADASAAQPSGKPESALPTVTASLEKTSDGSRDLVVQSQRSPSCGRSHAIIQQGAKDASFPGPSAEVHLQWYGLDGNSAVPKPSTYKFETTSCGTAADSVSVDVFPSNGSTLTIDGTWDFDLLKKCVQDLVTVLQGPKMTGIECTVGGSLTLQWGWKEQDVDDGASGDAEGARADDSWRVARWWNLQLGPSVKASFPFDVPVDKLIPNPLVAAAFVAANLKLTITVEGSLALDGTFEHRVLPAAAGEAAKEVSVAPTFGLDGSLSVSPELSVGRTSKYLGATAYAKTEVTAKTSVTGTFEAAPKLTFEVSIEPVVMSIGVMVEAGYFKRDHSMEIHVWQGHDWEFEWPKEQG